MSFLYSPSTYKMSKKLCSFIKMAVPVALARCRRQLAVFGRKEIIYPFARTASCLSHLGDKRGRCNIYIARMKTEFVHAGGSSGGAGLVILGILYFRPKIQGEIQLEPQKKKASFALNYISYEIIVVYLCLSVVVYVCVLFYAEIRMQLSTLGRLSKPCAGTSKEQNHKRTDSSLLGLTY